MAQFKVMFVCLGNICRSPLAHAVLEDMAGQENLDIFVESCGMGAWHIGDPSDPRMRRTAAGHGVRIDHYARRFQPSDLDDYDLIIPMDRENKNELLAYSNEGNRDKIILMRNWDPEGPGEVPDPWFGEDDGFETVYTIVERSCRKLLEDIKNRIS